MKQVHVDGIEPESTQRGVHIGGDVLGCDASASGMRVSALADDHDFVAHSAFAHPATEGALAVAVLAIDLGCVEGVAALGEHRIQQREAAPEVLGREHHRALHQPCDRLGHPGDSPALHRHAASRPSIGPGLVAVCPIAGRRGV